MLLWILIILAAVAAVCFAIDGAKPQAWTPRGLFLLAAIILIDLLSQAV